MQLPILEQRRIEAEVIKPIYDELVSRFGKEEARAVIGAAVREHSVRQASRFRAELGEGSGLPGLYSTLPLWTVNGALEIDVIEAGEERLDYNVKRCRYSEMYKEMGLHEIGDLLSCQRDAVFCKGVDPRIDLVRTQTIMSGASYCDFRYSIGDEASDEIG
jgi:hypothetical protein